MPWIAFGLVVVLFGGMFCVFGAIARTERRRLLAEADLAIQEFGRYDSDGLAATAAGLESDTEPAREPATRKVGAAAAR